MDITDRRALGARKSQILFTVVSFQVDGKQTIIQRNGNTNCSRFMQFNLCKYFLFIRNNLSLIILSALGQCIDVI